MRPRLCRMVHDALAGGHPAPCIADVMRAVECFHKASLVHDDIQDGDTERYGLPAVHVEHGIPVAIAVGDWLVAEGYGLLASCGAPRSAEMLAAAAESHRQLSEGQGDELVLRMKGAAPSPEELLSIYRRKTGEAFALAARLGAIAALPADDPRSAEIERGTVRFGLAFGVVFQMRDDLADGEAVLRRAHFDAAASECLAAADALPELAAALRRFAEGLCGFKKEGAAV